MSKHCTQGEAGDRIRDRQPFKASAMWARCGPPKRLTDAGLLPDEWAVRFLQADVTYIVYSYDTPVAWVEADGTAVVPPLRYSVTTTQHQGIAASALLGGSQERSEGEERRAVPFRAFGQRGGW